MCDEIDIDADGNVEDCCNSGCNNCILDTHQKSLLRNSDLTSKLNLIDSQYKQFKVIEIQQCTSNVNRYKFEFFNQEQINLDNFVLNVPSTYHLILRAPTSDDYIRKSGVKHDKSTIDEYISRPYTPILVDSNNLTFDILVKFESNGMMSQYLRQLKIGELTEWKGVYGAFQWNPKPTTKHLICISQGVAIAPMFNLISSILSNELDETLVHLFACFQNVDNILLRSELCLLQLFWNFKVRIYLSQQNCDLCKNEKTINCICIKDKLRFNESIYNYRLDENKLIDFYKGLNTDQHFTLVCANNLLENSVKSSLEKLNKNDKNCYFRIE